MGCCYSGLHEETNLVANLEKLEDSSKLTGNFSYMQSTPVNDISNPPENLEDPEVASEIYVISMKLPEYTSEPSVHSWILDGSPKLLN